MCVRQSATIPSLAAFPHRCGVLPVRPPFSFSSPRAASRRGFTLIELADTAVVFGREDLIALTINLPRKGSINFSVGVNGSDKSSRLRARYRVFRSPNLREWPALPVTLAWDRVEAARTITTLLPTAPEKDAASFFATLKQV